MPVSALTHLSFSVNKEELTKTIQTNRQELTTKIQNTIETDISKIKGKQIFLHFNMNWDFLYTISTYFGNHNHPI
jgi:hypothetical protein